MAKKIQEYTTSTDFGNNTLHCKITETTNDSSNASVISYEVWVTGTNYQFNYNNHLELLINGIEVFNGDPGPVVGDQIIISGELDDLVEHESNGTGAIGVYCFYRVLRSDYTYYTPAIDETFVLTVISRYKLSVSAGTGSIITVQRTSSPTGATGNISNNDNLYYGDVLKISFAPKPNYMIETHTVNGNAFTSGETHTVVNNVSVVATAIVLASKVMATNADIESVSTITVTKYDSSYYHSLQYSFGEATGYIASDGSVSNTEVKFSNSSVAFTVPDDFYYEIPDFFRGTCTITCRTYKNASSTTVLGTPTTCTFTATATALKAGPVTTISVEDANVDTLALTGDSSKIVRYMSVIQAVLSATPRYGASIVQEEINGVSVEDGVPELFYSVERDRIVSKATDSRGFTQQRTYRLQMIEYIPLTCNPIFSRLSPTSEYITLSFSGNFFNDSFGAYNNALVIRYRYREVGGTFGNWVVVSGAVIGSNGYTSNGKITLQDTFDYQKAYEFEVNAFDGDGTGTYVLTNITKSLVVRKGIPVFDWGENDFNVNCVLKHKGTNIFDIIYPVGSVYLSTSSTLPPAISAVGTWTSMSSGVSGTYAWERTV